MATRKTEALAVVARARRVGWGVEKTADGYRVTCPDGFPVLIHLTPSDVNHLGTVLRALNDHGFEVAEEAAAAREDQERRGRIAADREAAAKKIAKAQQRANALALAAGPYGQAQVDIAEILAVHDQPRVFQRVHMTPAMAAAILERNQPTEAAPWPNRPIRPGDVDDWSVILRGGRWRYTHQGVALDVDGRIQDGQHRLAAMVKTGIGGEIMVSVGMPRENFAVIDTGRRRTAAQVIAMAGASNSAAVSAAARLLVLHEMWGPSVLDHTHDRIQNDVIVGMYEKLHGEDLATAVAGGTQLRREIGGGPAGTIAGLYLIVHAMPEGDPRPTRFISELVQGVDPQLRGQDPVHVLRRTLLRQARQLAKKAPPAHHMALVVKAWSLQAQGRKVNQIRVVSGSTMPSVFLPPPDIEVDEQAA